MNIVFRMDASLAIGSGHTMRYLILGSASHERGTKASFICREHEGNLGNLIETLGLPVTRLPLPSADCRIEDAPAHATWLGRHRYSSNLADVCPIEINPCQAVDGGDYRAMRPFCRRTALRSPGEIRCT